MLIKPQGLVQIIDEHGRPGAVRKNQIQNGFYEIMSRLLQDPQSPFAIRKLYVEFKNAPTPTTIVTAPFFPASDGVEYYQGLVASTDTDYLRIDVVGSMLGYEPSGPGLVGGINSIKVFGYVGPGVGINGKPFNAASNSIVYGLAAVAAPVVADSSSDLIAGRLYLDAANQKLCPVAGVLTMNYTLIP